jgi:hypothetical protein
VEGSWKNQPPGNTGEKASGASKRPVGRPPPGGQPTQSSHEICLAKVSCMERKPHWYREDADGRLMEGESFQVILSQIPEGKFAMSPLKYYGMFKSGCGCDCCQDRQATLAKERKKQEWHECPMALRMPQCASRLQHSSRMSGHRREPAGRDAPCKRVAQRMPHCVRRLQHRRKAKRNATHKGVAQRMHHCARWLQQLKRQTWDAPCMRVAQRMPQCMSRFQFN